ncbi:MAG: hypothetical protein Kow0099_14820 [Candidatus Abyssubacteria bacterium]
MSCYDERPWLKFYDEWVDPDFTAPDVTYVELLEESFSDFVGRAALHFMGTTLTFRELDLYSRRFSTFLSEIGCGPGDVVGKVDKKAIRHVSQSSEKE